ncbi:hypothetical protein SKAU_G00331430 [Synaphobranchus kaupii]|uniref:Fucolectin tachylectin-4 pentraxin-1 domain-containing protein n=1 Tax=Synaphobranchus kaupii TaxID=118154 RepID=A0A9Q1ELD4_SYNKA|nr:hypothetical protein SKAU_G00331430 [Synaphobranchus kaupii]
MSQSDQKTKNVALRGKATQSVTLRGEHAALSQADHGIDGNRDSNFYHGSCFHTSNIPNPWWRVDLLETYAITSVTITNREDCCAERINGAQIHIGNSLENNGIDNPHLEYLRGIILDTSALQLTGEQITTNYPPVRTCCLTDRMKVKMMILLFQILAISTLKLVSALDISDKRLENVAVRGKASQSTLLRNGDRAYGHAGNANDGNRDSDFFHASCSHTHNDANPWWRVDLLEEYVIASVTITNRGDCVNCAAIIIGAEITIGDSLENNGIDNPQCSVVSSLAAGETKTFQCDVPLSGRYVTVYLPRRDYLEICEVESTLLRNGNGLYCHADNAIDGNRDSTFLHASCSHTNDDANPWWRVDLLEEYVIASVTITNRGDCCPEKINGAEIHIGNSLENNGIDNPQCSDVDSMALGETKTFQCEHPLSGRYVTVYLPRTGYLHLCEVEVNAWVPAPK